MRTNEDRAAAGKEAMDFYSEEIGYDEDRDDPDALTDLLADLMHAYGYRAVQNCNRIALEHYEFEIAEENE
jgi:hypothetical protein